MRLLLDTSVLIRLSEGLRPIPAIARAAIGNADAVRYVSACSWYEIAWKTRLGKLSAFISQELDRAVDLLVAEALPSSPAHARLAATLPGEIRDPFDRLIAAQAISERCRIVSPDTAFDALGADRLWA